jgi:hypothetical protein
MVTRTIGQTRSGHPMGPGLNVCILEADSHGSSQIVRDRDCQDWYLNILEGRIISQEAVALIQARTLAKEHGRSLGW